MNPRDHFLMLARYHVWATDRLLDRHVAPLTDEEYRRNAGLFFKSVHGTLNHLLVAERGLWFERFANELLVGEWAIHLSGVEECDTAIDGLANQGNG